MSIFRRIKAAFQSRNRTLQAVRTKSGGYGHDSPKFPGWGRGWGWRGNPYYQDYYDGDPIVKQFSPETILVDAQTGHVLAQGVRANRPNNMWIRVEEAAPQGNGMIVRIVTGGLGVSDSMFVLQLPIVDRPINFPNSKVVFVP